MFLSRCHRMYKIDNRIAKIVHQIHSCRQSDTVNDKNRTGLRFKPICLHCKKMKNECTDRLTTG